MTRATFYLAPSLMTEIEIAMLKMRTAHGYRAGKSAIARAALRSFLAAFDADQGAALGQVKAEQAKGE